MEEAVDLPSDRLLMMMMNFTTGQPMKSVDT